MGLTQVLLPIALEFYLFEAFVNMEKLLIDWLYKSTFKGWVCTYGSLVLQVSHYS